MLSIFNKIPTVGNDEPYIKKTESFNADTNKRYLVEMTDGVSKEITINSGIGNDYLTLNFVNWKRGLVGLNAKLKFVNEPLSNGEAVFDSYLVDRPCIVNFRLVDGKWIIESATGLDGNYIDLEAQLNELKSWPKTFVTENGTLVAHHDGRLEASHGLRFGRVDFTAVGQVGVMGYKNWDFPVNDEFKFVEPPIVHVEPSSAANTWQWGSHAQPSKWLVSYTLVSTNIGPADAAVELKASGRWK